jgi:hypothetical protein
MRGIKVPQRLHGRVECPRRHLAELLTLPQQFHEFQWRIVQGAEAIEHTKRRMLVIQAEYPLQPRNFRQRCRDQTLGRSRIRVVQLNHRVCP